MVTIVAVSLVAVVFAYVAWRAWRKHETVNPPWAMSEFHHRMGRGHPRRSVEAGAPDSRLTLPVLDSRCPIWTGGLPCSSSFFGSGCLSASWASLLS